VSGIGNRYAVVMDDLSERLDEIDSRLGHVKEYL
jgi:hypothetical protein